MAVQVTPTDAEADIQAVETQEWIDSLAWVLDHQGPERVRHLLEDLQIAARRAGVRIPFSANTPHINTIPAHEEVPYPGSREIERRIKSLIRWNAMAMVVRANHEESGIGGHISTYASAATLYEVAFNHFLHGKSEHYDGDQVYFQGHSSPGIYARAFLEGRLSEGQLVNFRRELREGRGRGLASYPHPWLMPDFWEFPTVSMGLAPIQAIYQARFNHYLEDRGLHPTSNHKVWAFLGDGEMDEPESLGAITLASREQLDNLIFVVNCNLQRLDGPVRGNGKIIQELEAAFRGAGWNVIKVIWGADWDPLLDRDSDGLLVRRMGEVVDGDSQKYAAFPGEFIRNHFFGTSPKLKEMVAHLSDEQLRRLRLGGHDPQKVYNAFKAAVDHKGSPTVILARTIKGYGLGEAGEGRNITHQQKKLDQEELLEFRTRFGIPLSDDEARDATFYRPPESSPEMVYLQERRRGLGGPVPTRGVRCEPLPPLDPAVFDEFGEGSNGRPVSTTMAFVRVLSKLLKDPQIGRLIVPIIPDEARTFGMDSLFRQIGIYSHAGQLYEPVDASSLLFYREAKDGQLLEEGITEAGSMCSFIAAGSAHATHGINTIPFFVFYSMFGLQRIGDLIWAAADMRTRGFLVAGTAGRTTLNGEGLQHQDGHSHLLAYPVPNLRAFDPAWAYELAVIIRDGIRRMYTDQEDVFYYLTVANEPYPMPARPDHVTDEGILRGMYRYRPADAPDGKARAHLFGSGAILNQALAAQQLLAERFDVAADVWSITSYKELHRDGLDCDRWNRLHPGEEPRTPWLRRCLAETEGVYVLASDYVKALPESIASWFPRRPQALGTDGFGRSDSRAVLRRFFEVDAAHIAAAALAALAREGAIGHDRVATAIAELGIDPDSPNPVTL
ncbi:MAG TPA: pyruvate dehydrogenase (acetyl-transferring), homodimeric type [Thermoanaerobaculales bacterium]|nr:pyruvate dehydrogenase (acetyl-transferring), homodimeric type [Thermoanaerobaculales bacterium]HQL30388.1 pyruvate dehydrogenase (acetyl-transferring), homodimeric type [Thermoanaerobaculales bacterium]